jgi:hypothetical protein
MATLQYKLLPITVLILCSAFANSAAISLAQNSAPDGWNWGPLLSVRRTAFSCCQADDSVVTVGGTYWTNLGTATPQKRWLASVERLTSSSGNWTSLPDFPVEIDYALLVFANQRLIAVGGQNNDGLLSATRYLDFEDPEFRWREGPPLPRPLARLRGGVRNSWVVAVTDEPQLSGKQDIAGSKVLAWDTANPAAAWEEIGAVPEPSIGNRAVAIADGRLYVFGGAAADESGELRLSPRVWCFDLQRKEWSESAPLPIAVRDATARALDSNTIAVVGGVEEAVSADAAPDGVSRILLSTRVMCFDTRSNKFTAAAPLNMAVADHGVAVLGDDLLVVGGEDSQYRTRTDLVQSIDRRNLGSGNREGKSEIAGQVK